MKCPLCSEHSFRSFSEFLRHVRLFHADRPNFSLQCNLQGCSRTYTKFESYRNHIYTYHDVSAIEAEDVENIEDSDSNPLEVPSTTDDAASREPSEEPSIEDGIVDIQKASAVWILKTRELHRLPLSVMDAVMVDVQSLYDALSQNSLHRVTSMLRKTGVDVSTIEQVSKEFTVNRKIFSGLETQSQQMKYFSENFNMVVNSSSIHPKLTPSCYNTT